MHHLLLAFRYSLHVLYILEKFESSIMNSITRFYILIARYSKVVNSIINLIVDAI